MNADFEQEETEDGKDWGFYANLASQARHEMDAQLLLFAHAKRGHQLTRIL
jgi:hypothetical protein